MTKEQSSLNLADAGASSASTGGGPSEVARLNPRSQMAYDTIESAFPDVDPGLRPFGDKVLVQIRTPKTMTTGGIYIPEESRETEQWNTQVAKVIALGPLAYHNRDTGELWPEGLWVEPGMFVRSPKYGGDRWQVPVPNSRDSALFVLFRDHDLGGEIPEDRALETLAYII